MMVAIAYLAVLFGAVNILTGIAGITGVSASVRRSDVSVVIHARPVRHRDPSGVVYYSDNTGEIHVPVKSLIYFAATIGGFVASCVALWALAYCRLVIPTRQAKLRRELVDIMNRTNDSRVRPERVKRVRQGSALK
jgi:hypothetical protein